jgi:hypothetical protein
VDDENVDDAISSRRCEPRDTCEIKAAIHLVPRRRLPCVIKDISSRGARIVIAQAVKLPRHIFLLIPVVDEIVETKHCELRWRIGDVAGLRFYTPPPEAPAQAEETLATPVVPFKPLI